MGEGGNPKICQNKIYGSPENRTPERYEQVNDTYKKWIVTK